MPTEALEFAKNRLRSEAEHLRVRVAVLVGALDKLGLVPLFASALLTIWNVHEALSQHGNALPVPIPVLYTIAGCLLFFYLASLGLISASHRIDELTQILELGLAHKSRSVAQSAIVED